VANASSGAVFDQSDSGGGKFLSDTAAAATEKPKGKKK
jgi:hypothetical protein